MTLLIAGSVIWLFLAAIPAFADNGPHMVSVNSGVQGINADSCAGCHRAHTAQDASLLIDDLPAMCLVCHGPAGTGATTDVVDGVQYSAADGSKSIAGALRGGGFTYARIGSGNPTRYSFQVPVIQNGSGFTGIVPVATTGSPTTSRHMNLDGTAFGPGVAWGNGPIDGTVNPGPGVSITCTSCHNPHGNGKYRILIPIPTPATTGTGQTFVPASAAANVTDAAPVASGQVRNYTNPPAQYLSQLATSGTPDYWRYCAPQWNNCSGANLGEKPNGLASSAFRRQITAWCETCHTRYDGPPGSATYAGGPSGDPIFAFVHTTEGNPACTQCHVAHGSNAAMGGVYSSTFPYPHDPAATTGIVYSGSSRLLKIDNRGTCQMCHDPTGTVTSAGVTTP